MLLCNYLFVKGYQLGIKTRNYDDCPVLGGIIIVGMWITYILGGTLLLISHFFHISPSQINRYIYSIILLGGLGIYYSYKGRGHKLVERYEQKQHPFYHLSPYIVVPVALLSSLGFLALAGFIYIYNQ